MILRYATADITDDELRKKVIWKGQSLLSAFRTFDKDGDGVVNKVEFSTGLKLCGIDLPRDQVRDCSPDCGILLGLLKVDQEVRRSA